MVPWRGKFALRQQRRRRAALPRPYGWVPKRGKKEEGLHWCSPPCTWLRFALANLSNLAMAGKVRGGAAKAKAKAKAVKASVLPDAASRMRFSRWLEVLLPACPQS